MIQTTDLSKHFANTSSPAVNNVSLRVNSGEIFGLLGPNGAGKTTLISMLSNLVAPSSGSIAINGNTYAANGFAIRSTIGVVPQELAIYPTLTAFENLSYFGSMYGLSGARLKSAIDEHLEFLGLTEFAHRQVGKFSGGMKRRVNLAAALLHKPDLVFLDEPTVGVDVQSRQTILEHLVQLNNDGVTLLYTSHLLNEAEKFCTRIAIMDEGVILAEGIPNELIVQTPEANNLEDLFIVLTGSALRDYA